MFPADALQAVWMEEKMQEKMQQWENDVVVKERSIQAERDAQLAAQQQMAIQSMGQPQLPRGLDTMPSPSATSAFFGWFPPNVFGRGRDASRNPTFPTLASSVAWKSPFSSPALSTAPTRTPSPVQPTAASVAPVSNTAASTAAAAAAAPMIATAPVERR